ncbi:MAG: carnitinyl-CoA dehydratase [Alphaproteobacteria bacterium]|nr:carnitinyl-CoA dehydratase [Alphaproteobacteria bacterium]
MTVVRTMRRGAILEITLDRPKANAIDAATSREMDRVFAGFRDDPSARVAILTGAGERFFSAGWDLRSAGDGDMNFGEGGFGGIMRRFDLTKPVIAAVNGYCAAGGFEMALACDLMVAAEHAVFFLSEVNLGLTCDAGTVPRLLRLLPQPLAVEMLLTGRRLTAPEAFAHGMLARVVPGPLVMDTAREIAERIVAAAPISVAAVKQMLDACGHASAEEAYALGDAGKLPLRTQAWASEDAKEGPRAFAEKRKPLWRGR